MSEFKVDDYVRRLAAADLGSAELDALLLEANLPHPSRPDRVFPLGIIVDDGRRYGWSLKPVDLGPFVDGLAGGKVKGLRGWRVFPLGIVAPESYRLEVDFGPTLE